MGFEFDATRKIVATGPSPCDIALFGEAGGATEYDQRRSFAGKAGIVLNTYLSSAGLTRHRVYVDNIYPYWTGPKNPDPTDDQVRGNLENLKRTLLKVRPRVIGCLGRISAKWILYNGEKDVDLDSHHGIAFERDWPWGKVLVVPCYHPAAGFYEPINSGRCQYDLHQVAKAAKGEVAPHVLREMPTSSMHEFPHYRSGDVQIRIGDAIDTEGTRAHPSLISWATVVESGKTLSFVARVNMKVTSSPTLPPRATFHFALHDLPVIRAMRGDTSNLEVDDTMVMAFELGGVEPQGLKPLAFRHLGIEMTEYPEVVKPYFDRAVRKYIMKLLDTPLPAKGKTVWVERKNPKTGEIEDKLYTPKPPRERFWSVAAAATKDGDPVKVWKDLPEDYRKLAEKNLPDDRFPVFSQALELVPEEKVVKYAGADAWATRNLAPILLKKLDEMGVREAYEVDRKSLRYVDLMQSEGLPVNVERTRELSETLEKRLEDTRKKMVKGIGRRFNPGSTDDVAEILYQDFRLTVPKLTDGGDPSTDKKAIQILRGRAKFEIEYEEDRERATNFLDSLISYRETQKNRSTYVDVILRTARETLEGWRVFPILKNTRVASGRLSSGSIGGEDTLNVLAMPTRTEEGKKIRDLFEAPDGWEYLSSDLSQIELRVMAGASKDKRMLGAFVNGEDLHILTTSIIFGIAKEKIDKHSPQRFVGKCFHPDTEVLTRTRGWQKIKDVTVEEEIAQAWPQIGGSAELEWVKPLEVFTKKHWSKHLIHFTSEGVDVSVTPDHRMLYFTGKRLVPRVSFAADLPEYGQMLGAGQLQDEFSDQIIQPSENILRLAVAAQADGSYCNSKTKIYFGFSKKRKIDRLRELLKSVDPKGVFWEENKRKKGVTCFITSSKLSARIRACLDSDKTLSWRMLRYDISLRLAILDEARFWDSSDKGGSYTYVSVIEKNCDILQALAATSGFSSRRGKDIHPKNPEHKTAYLLSVKDKKHSYLRGISRETTEFTEEVSCLSVPSSFVLVRYNGTTSIQGQTLNFAIMYGISARALLDQLYANGIYDYSLRDCEKFIAEWFKVYPGVREFLEWCWEEAEKTGVVRDWMGRLRWVPNIRLPGGPMKEAAKREVGNHPIQSGAHEQVKLAEIELLPWMQKNREIVRPVLQIHDELLCLAKKGHQKKVAARVVAAMVKGAEKRFGVPVKADSSWGRTWAQAK